MGPDIVTVIEGREEREDDVERVKELLKRERKRFVRGVSFVHPLKYTGVAGKLYYSEQSDIGI